jgi:FkbM family methyltransferase
VLLSLRDLSTRYDLRITGVVHVGAHLGEEAEVYDRMGVPRVLWIEANPDLLASLTRHVDRFAGQAAVQALVADDDGCVLPFHVANNGQSSSLLDFGTHPQHAPDVWFVETKHLPSTTLDRVLSDHDFRDFNLLNLDLQGAELRCLRGARRALQQVDCVYTEVNEDHLYRGGALVGELDEFLTGFERVATAMTPAGWGDALYVRRDALPPRARRWGRARRAR